MKILIAHNQYQARGGEDVVFEAEAALLAEAGHRVETLVVNNDTIDSFSARVRTMLATADNPDGKRAMAEAIDRFSPDVVHVHNYFPLLSPAVFDVCRQKGVPAVATLHNFRSICVGGMLLRDGQICHKCLDTTNLWGVVHRCYRDSFAGSAASAWMISSHQRRGTWTRPGLRLIALSRFAREVFIKSGFRAEAIDVKPNFLRDPGEPDFSQPRQGLLYVGRLSREKGVAVLVKAAAKAGCTLRIAGEGPELAALRAEATDNVTFLGAISRDQVMAEMARATALVVPSLWYEGFPMVIAEAFARATPVIASALGGLAEIVEDGRTGGLAAPGDVNDLTFKILEFNNKAGFAAECGRTAREAYLRSYTPETNLRQLESIYRSATGSADR
jgi:glycosyltransferase involved in cell wall biosynthesis